MPQAGSRFATHRLRPAAARWLAKAGPSGDRDANFSGFEEAFDRLAFSVLML
jgi:hypothetical protein